MSYIRPLSNPERLYIFGGTKGIEIYNTDAIVPYVVPFEKFKYVMNQFYHFQSCLISYEGLTLRELVDLPGSDQDAYKWVLTYRNNKTIAYKTTWFYIAANTVDEDK